nr:serine/threonine-protein phosphatase 6 regulatory subunit 3-like isoform X2 [Tanacetum cinerariifolium]
LYACHGLKWYCSYCLILDEMMFTGAGDLLMLLNVTLDEKVLPTTYGQLKPPLGKHRLKDSDIW